MNEKVAREQIDDIGLIEIYNPDQNVIDIEVLMGIASAVSGFISEDSVRAILIKSRGKDFSVGYDGSCKRLRDNSWLLTVYDTSSAIYNMIRSSGKPFFVSVKGKCLGLGLELALANDFIQVYPGVKMGFPDYEFGIPSLMMPPASMEDRIGNGVIYRNILTSRILSGEDAVKFGIADSLEQDSYDPVKWVKGVMSGLNFQIFSIAKQQRFPDPSIMREYRSFIKSYDTSVVRIKELESKRLLI